MKIKKLCAVALLLLLSFYAKAQNWQAYKGVWLKGYDNAAQAPVPPSGYSALTYFADSLGTYVYDWDSLAWLRIPGAGSGGGGGGLVTASNMLSVSPAGNVIAGGVATHDTYNHLGLNSITWSSPTAKIHIPRAESVFPFRQSLYITVGDTSDNAVNNNARLILEDVPVDIPRAELRAGINASNSGRIVAEPNSARLQLNTGQISVEVTSTQSAMKHNNVQFAIQGGNHWATLSESGRSTFRTTLNTNEVLTEVTTASDNLRMTTASGAIILDDEIVFPQITENTNLTDSVMMLDGNGRIFWKTISGGGGSVTADNGLNIDPAGNVRIGTSSLPGFVEDDGAVFSTDSLNMAISHFWFTPDSVQIGNLADLGEGYVPAYVLMKNGLLSGHTSNSSFQLQPGGTNTMSILWGTSPLFSFGSTRLQFGSASLAPAVRFFEIANGDLLQYTSDIGADMAFQTMDGATGTESTGDILIRTGSVTSGTGAVGDIEIRLGSQAGSGSGGAIQLDPSTGFLIISNIPTSDPCGSAPSGTVWNNSGVLSICP